MTEPTGVLATSEPGQTTTLSSEEYRLLLNALELGRRKGDKEADAISVAIESNHRRSPTEIGTLARFLTRIMQSLGADEVSGLLATPYDEPIVLLMDEDGEERFKCLTALLKLLERGDWLSDFLITYVPFWLERATTPQDIMQSLVGQAHNFEVDVSGAKRMLASYPALFENGRPAEQETRQ